MGELQRSTFSCEEREKKTTEYRDDINKQVLAVRRQIEQAELEAMKGEKVSSTCAIRPGGRVFGGRGGDRRGRGERGERGDAGALSRRRFEERRQVVERTVREAETTGTDVALSRCPPSRLRCARRLHTSPQVAARRKFERFGSDDLKNRHSFPRVN